MKSTNKQSIVVGDYNFDNSWTKEYQVIIDNGFHDVLTDFISSSAHTMYKTKRFKAWRPDKICIDQFDEKVKQFNKT